MTYSDQRRVSRNNGMPLLGRKEMATHSSILAWEIPWTEEPDGLQFIGCKGVRHDLVPEHTGSYPKSFGD